MDDDDVGQTVLNPEDEEEEGNFLFEGEGGEMAQEEEDEPPPPPPQEDKELLFLIEFLVDTLNIFPENMFIENIDPCALQGATSIVLTFLHFPSMVIGETDSDPEKLTGGTEIVFNTGKSLMFALTESQFEEPPPVFLAITAAKDMPHAYKFPKILIGKTKIDLSELFKQVFNKYDENPQKTVSKSIKDKYELIGEKDKPAGEVSIYIRLTCMGENVVTEFQRNETPGEPLLFKSKESKKVYECVPTELPSDDKARTLPGYGDEKKKAVCEEVKYAPPPDPEDENYEEIFAEINGSAVTIQVEKSRRKDPPKKYHVSDFCDCDIPLPQDLVAGLSDLSLSPASQGDVNLGGGGEIPPIDKKVGLDSAKRLVFPVPPVEALAKPGALTNSIVYNVKTCPEGDKHGHQKNNSYRIITDNNPEGEPPKMPNDPEKDVFVFKLIKKGRKDKGKETLELEFKTPKDKIVPPKKIPYMKETGSGPEKPKKGSKKK